MKVLGTAGLGLVLLLLSVACATAVAPTSAPAPVAPPKDAGEALPSPAQERIIVRSAKMALLVADVSDTRNKIANLALSFGGYVVSSQLAGAEGDVRGSISIRLPDGKLDEALSKLRDLAVRVQSESTSATDITDQYVDLKSRLKNAEASEAQYVSLLQTAKNTDDVVKIYDRLTQTRREIEQIKGRM